MGINLTFYVSSKSNNINCVPLRKIDCIDVILFVQNH